MIYILIVYWYGVTSGSSGKAALAIEFNNLQSCRAAAAEITKKRAADVVLCAEKGLKQ